MPKTRLQGVTELRRVMRQLPRALQRQVLTNATRAGARVIQRAALDNLPDSERSDVIIRKQRTPPSEVLMRVGIPRNKPQLMWLEFGTDAHTLQTRRAEVLVDPETGTVFGPSVEHPGQSPAPWLRPAFEEKKREALRAIADAIAPNLDRVARRLAGARGRRLFGGRRR